MTQFDQDVISHEGYLYTNQALKSSRLANARQTKITKSALGSIKGKKVIDVGCGDGTYTYKVYCWGKPKIMVGVDISKEAINLAQRKFSQKKKRLFFKHYSCYQMPYSQRSFDVAIARGILHHLENPVKGLSIIAKIANQAFIIEPNGYNLILKLIEKISPYHRQHKEKSFTPVTLRKWIKDSGGKIIKENYIGIVPFFCPDWMAIFLKKIEPLIEKTPFLKNLFCASYTVLITNSAQLKS